MIREILWALYVLSFFYCMWRLIRRYKMSSHDGVTGPTPGLDVMGVIFLAPILAAVDLVATGIIAIKRARKR